MWTENTLKVQRKEIFNSEYLLEKQELSLALIFHNKIRGVFAWIIHELRLEVCCHGIHMEEQQVKGLVSYEANAREVGSKSKLQCLNGMAKLGLIQRGVWTQNICFYKCLTSVQFISVAQSYPTLCDPMNHSMPGLPVHRQLLESTQTHVHCVSDAIQPSHPLSSSSPPALNLSQHQGLFQ